jgi:RHH-type proline utilization regulon transcriptional repressor/proline dehydrogenase/delta 1-pyrroline-5-carboxylate dehydrogenase
MNTPESAILSRGQSILSAMSEQKVSLFSKDYWYGSIMEWSMKNPTFKTQMFRFVDVLPTLSSADSVTKHIEEYFADPKTGELPKVFGVGLGLGKLLPSLMAKTIKSNVTQMAKMFIVGENPADTLKNLREIREKKGLTFTVDILGEVTLSEKEALAYQAQYLELMDALAKEASQFKPNPLLDQDHEGPIPRVNISVKLTALSSQISELAWEATKAQLKERLRPLFRKAMQLGVFLNLDMEHYSVKNLTLEVFKEMLLEPEFRSYPHWGCVIQAYLKDSYSDLESLVSFAKQRGTPFTVRLVKGAYWDTEIIEAKQKLWPIPVFEHKWETDANYEECSKLLLEHFPHIRVAFASHNVRSISFALETAKNLGVPSAAIEVQMLYGMADPIKKALLQQGVRVREYCPMGEMLPGMSYLVRRLLENTSNESWLRGKFAEGRSSEELLRDPRTRLTRPLSEIRKDFSLSYKDPQRFDNEALWDFTQAEKRELVQAAITKARSSFPQKVPVILGGTAHTAGGSGLSQAWETLSRQSPNDASILVAQVSLADIAAAEEAIKVLKQGQKTWARKSFSERARYLDMVAEWLNQHRADIIATQVWEVGKPWAEADADVAEAIDFCRYYAMMARQYDTPVRQASHVPGEWNSYRYRPRGISLVISPWNFPLAIFTGQTVAALVTGNPVIMKPAEQSSLVAYWLARAFMAVGLPQDVWAFLPARGEVVGAHLVKHPDVANIAFTGSKAVGLWILENAQKLAPGQRHVKRCIVEMGGKNAIIIDEDADLDEAVSGVLYSAFGFSGQKCSACSRVIVLDAVYDKFVGRLVEAAKSLKVLPAFEPGCDVGPVVDEEACSRIRGIIERAKKDYRLEVELPSPQGACFVSACIFSEVDPKSYLGQEEIFGPVLAIFRARDLDHALSLANDVEYALTGGCYSRSPANIAKVMDDLECGNMYINRGITGAMVDRHPFGGFKLSGVGSKTGGIDYLLQFMEPQSLSENQVRRGFAPEG